MLNPLYTVKIYSTNIRFPDCTCLCSPQPLNPDEILFQLHSINGIVIVVFMMIDYIQDYKT